MRLLIILGLVCLAVSAQARRRIRRGNLISCYTCAAVGKNANAANAACLAQGRLQQCTYNQQNCINTVRINDHGNIEVIKGCKEDTACENNFAQNDAAGNSEQLINKIQCDNDAIPSVCRCCCNSSKCNDQALFCKSEKLNLWNQAIQNIRRRGRNMRKNEQDKNKSLDRKNRRG
jgi:hypothetical protein